jgi:hypothetical protein
MKKFFIHVVIGILLLGSGLYYFSSRSAPAPEDRPERSVSSPQAPPTPSETRHVQQEVKLERPGTREQEAAAGHAKDIEEIKEQIYALNIESVEDIPLLDRVIQTGDAPTQGFWKGDWVSVDDNKEDRNGFYLQPQDDGTFVYFPDENSTRTYTFFETPKTYTYDPVHREFSWQLDYYGKTITHRAKFVNEDVLVTMLISGRKVTLDIYTRDPGDKDNLSAAE